MAAPVAALQGAKAGVNVAVHAGGLATRAAGEIWSRLDAKGKASLAALAFLGYNQFAVWWNDWQTEFASSTVGNALKWHRPILPCVVQGKVYTGRDYPNVPPSATKEIPIDLAESGFLGPAIVWDVLSGPATAVAQDIAKLTTWW